MQALAGTHLRATSGVRPLQRGSRTSLKVRAEVVEIPEQYKKLSPRGDRVLVKVAEEEKQTRGGILLPVSAVKKPTSGEVVDLGDGRTGSGETREFYLKKGQTVLYSKFGFMYTDLKLNKEDYILIREDDVIGIMPRPNATAEDVPQLQPLSDRVLVKVYDTADVTVGGVMLPESAKERPLSGEVVTTGPGRYDSAAEGKRHPMKVKPGDKILYFKYAGDNMETPDGQKYVVLREDDILCKA
ncbi:chaperonin 10 kd subunit-domain-containing protein [Dunaliella salina]|uniref:Chaperonin 10 kd subunit-domain-containing protein n=1 Tax=Dunaliella salina TaxID=3046 RepID=A0ABQ7GED0_DUNSA|nr:chaperonin 10 kd subunit-domain-containing protein [Dunaliella salina]|eukprot:KAF5832968.1 chaperonin 10 kd subunit-domain-containing protein [Dunaliella salina]